MNQPNQGYAPQGQAPQQGYAPQQGHAPAPQQGYAPQGQQGHAPHQQGYAPQQGHAPAPQQGYAPQGQAPQQGYAPQQGQQQQQAPQEDLSAVRVKLAKGSPRRSDIDWDYWRNVHDSQSFNLPKSPDEAQGLPMGTFEAQVIYSKWQRKREEWGGGLSLRLQLGFKAEVNGQPYPYKVWTSIGQGNAEGMSEFATAVCPWKNIGEDDFGPNDALGRNCLIGIGYGTGKWSQTGAEPKICIQNWRASKSQAQPQAQQQAQPHAQQQAQQQAAPQQGYQQHQQAAPPQQQYQQQQPPQQQQQYQQQPQAAPQQGYQQYQPPPKQQYQQQPQASPQQGYQAPQGGYGKTYGGNVPAHQGAPAKGYAPDQSDLPF